MKKIFVNTHMPPDFKYGGVVQSGSKLYEHMFEIEPWECLTTSDSPSGVKEAYVDYELKVSRSLIMKRFGFAPWFVFHAFSAIRKADFVFINGTVTFPTIVAQIFAWLFGVPYAVSLRGSLETWRMRHKRWKKALYYKVFVFPLMRRASFLHATCVDEARSARTFGFENVEIISNAVDLAEYPVREKRKKDFFQFLFLSRTDREKGIDILIPAFVALRDMYPQRAFKLTIVGPDNQSYFRKNFLPLPTGVDYISGLYGEDKVAAYIDADVFVLPSYSENFGNVIAEALACGTAVITTTGTPWRDVVDFDCGFFIKPDYASLLNAMDSVVSLSFSELVQMGQRGRALIAKKYLWDNKATELAAVIENYLCRKK